MVPNTMAWRYVMDLDETLVAQAFATSSAHRVNIRLSEEECVGDTNLRHCYCDECKLGILSKKIGTEKNVLGIEKRKEGAYCEDVVVLAEHHLGRVPSEGAMSSGCL